MGPTERVVVLIDMDCFYCQVEEKLNPQLEGKPIAVAQYKAWRGGGIIAVNYPARDQGVTRHMRGDDAKKKCPSINLVRVPEVRGKADLTKYRDAGKKVADVLATFTSLLERASVDEAYLDITELVNNRMETNLNDLTISNLKNTFVVGYDTADFLDIAVVNREFSENNFKLAIGGLITEEIRRAVLEKTGYKCSAGIAHNKILAKLVCGLHKPNKQTILPHDAVEKFFDTIPINKIKSLGGKFGQTLAEDLQITFMGQLSKISERELTQRYDEKTAKWLYNISRGIDLDPVTTKLISKSIACCKNFQGKSALTTSESVQHWLNELAEEMAERLEKDMKENNRKAKQIVVSFTQEMNRKEISSSRTHPLTSYESKKIAQYAFDVIKKFCLRTDERFHLKFLGLSAGHFEDIKKVREITSFFKCVQIQENVFESESRVSSVQSLMDNSVKDDGIVDENINSVDYEVDPDVYLQLTQELEENVSELIFYDDTCRLKQELNNEIELNGTSSLSNYLKKAAHNNLQSIENLKKQTNRSPSSFFKQYFNQTKETKIILEDNTKNEVTQLVRCINQDEDLDENYETAPTEEELIDMCTDCNKKIPKSELMSHKDFHFALKLMKSDTDHYKPTHNIIRSKKTDTNNKKRKCVGNSRNLKSFFKTDTSTDSSDLTETCPECKRKIKREDVANHMDYHIAKKIHLEINSVNSVQYPIKPKFGDKTKIPSSSKTVTSFFKRL